MIYAILIIAGAILYRVGGSDLFLSNKTKYRDAGTALCGAVLVAYHHQWSLSFLGWVGLVCSFGLSWGAFTTYFKKKGTDAQWYNWLFVGLAFGIAFLPFAWATGAWVAFGLRTAVCAILVMGWSQLIGNAVAEELGRGLIFCATLLIL